MPRGRRSKQPSLGSGTDDSSYQAMAVDGSSSFVDPNSMRDEDYQPDQTTGVGTEDSNDTSMDDYASPEEGGKRKRGAGAGRGRGRGRPGPGRGSRGGRVSGTGRTPPGAGAGDGADAEEEDGLFGAILGGRAALQSVVDDWIESYRQEREGPTLALLQLFIRASGCRGKITPQMRAALDNGQIIRDLTNEFDEESHEYPVVMTGPKWKKFRGNFCEFIHTLIRQCQYSIIYDQYIMESIFSMLIGLSDSQVRAFRHTATLAAMKFMTALVDVALTLSINLDNTQRQYDLERQKTPANAGRGQRPNERLDMLMSKRQELEENNEDIKTMLGYLFKSIFVHRYRDVVPEIRSICMNEIGTWMKRLPNMFLDDSYLKYVGWTLHDKVGDVRLKCLHSLLPLYESEEIARKMELFTNKFKDRIVAMTLDKEYEVAVQAVKLIINIHKHHRDILTDKDCEQVYELVFATHRAVAQAAGEFLNERLFQVDEEGTANLRSKRGKKRSVHTPLIRDLIQFFIESELHEHGTYLVDSLIESHPMMKDWECMTDLLIEEPGADEEQLDDRQETSLIEMMVCCVKQAATGEVPIGRAQARKQQPTAKEVKLVQEDKNRISEHFITILPILLAKYKADPDKVANLLIIPQFFELNYFTQQQKQLEELLKIVNQIVEIHSDKEVLDTAAKTYESLFDDRYTFKRTVNQYKNELLDSLDKKYREAAENFQANPTVDDELVAVQVKKLAAFYSCHDLTSLNLWDDIFDKWVRSVNAEPVPVEATRNSIQACHMGLVWDLHQLSESRAPSRKIDQHKNKLEDFMKELQNLLRNDSEELQEEAFVTICDLLVIFSDKLSNDSPAVAPLIYKPKKELIDLMEEFIQQRVFVEPDEDEMEDQNRRMEMVNKNRHFLAGYCKLFVFNIMPIKKAAIVFRHYVKFFTDYGDIIKMALGKAREINKIITARTMANALISVFTDLQKEAHNNPNAFTKQDEDFQALKELAKRFALSFGLDNNKNREAVAELHREGINFSVNRTENPANPLGQPPNIPFFEILSEFSNKLIKQDRKCVVDYLDSAVKKAFGPHIHNDEWPPLATYRQNLLQHNEFDIPMNRAPGRQYRMKKRTEEEEENESEGESEMND